MKKKPKLTETAYAVKSGDVFVLSAICTYRQHAKDWQKEWPGSKIVKVKIIEQ